MPRVFYYFTLGGLRLVGFSSPWWLLSNESTARWTWEGYEFREAADTIHAYGHTIARAPTDDIAFAGDKLAWVHYFAYKFVADREGDSNGGACPGSQIVNMNARSQMPVGGSRMP